jgi:undecaprenyl-diphosphatase
VSTLQALVLGIVQGLTEFLPISSSAHLVLVPELAGWSRPSLPFLVLLHSATLVALVIYFRRELAAAVIGMVKAGPQRRLLGLLVLGTAPAAIIGVVFETEFEAFYAEPVGVALQLMVTGVLLIGAELLTKRSSKVTVEPASDDSTIPEAEDITGGLSWKGALGVGFSQAAAIVPGISRSGATIAGGLLAGLTRVAAARFSFLLSIPILFGTSLFELPRLDGAPLGAGPLLVGFIASMVSGYLAIAGMISYLQRRGLVPFAVYCLVVGLAAALVLSGR